MAEIEAKKLFAKKWGDKFNSPAPTYENMVTQDDITTRITEVKQRIDSLSLQLEKENFQLDFLQNGLEALHGSSASEQQIGADFQIQQLNCKTSSNKSSNRISKVMENVKMFEQGESTEQVDEERADRKPIASNRASLNRKRAPYLEVWECKTGEDVAQPTHSKSNEEIMKDVNISGNKTLLPQGKSRPLSYPVRDNYVEVWTCNTGENPDPTNPDLDVALYGLGEHQTLPNNSVVRLRNKERNDPLTNRLTWPTQAATNNHNESYSSLSQMDNSISVDDIEPSKIAASNLLVKDVSSDENLPAVAPKTSAFKSATIATGREYDGELDDIRHALTTSDRISNTYDRRYLRCDEQFDYQDDEECYDDDLNEAEEESIGSDSDHSSYSNEVLDDNDSFSLKDDTIGSMEFTDEDFGDDSSNEASSEQKSFVSGAASSLVDYQKVRNIAEAEKLRMRWWVVSSLLESEETYLEYLNTLLLYMKPIKATIDSSQPVMSATDFDTLFYRVLDLHKLHAKFYENLKPKLENWSADSVVSDVFQRLATKLVFYADYVKNYKRAQQTAEKCAKENKQFAFIIESLKVQSHKTKGSESISLTEILYKPVERVMRHTLVLQDLLRYTPHRHPDYHILREVLKHGQLFLEKISQQAAHKKAPSAASKAAARSAERDMKKDGYLVEITMDGQRKLRHIFLFSDLLLCTKLKNASGVFHSKDTYECKWYIPLADLSFKQPKDVEGVMKVPDTNDDELRDLTIKASGFKREIAAEKKKLNHHQKKSVTANQSETEAKRSLTSRHLSRLRRKLAEIEGQIILAAPNLPLRVFHMQGKCYMLLMSSDFEHDEWSQAVIKCQENCFKSFTLTTLEVQNLLTSCVRNRKVSRVGMMLAEDDGDMLSGYITVTIHSGGGFLHSCSPYVKLEVDSYGHFQTRATTKVCNNTQQPQWDDEFEFEVDGAQILRILCYDSSKGRAVSYEGDVLIAKGTVNLAQDSLKSDEWSCEKILINGLDINISIKFTPREQTLLRVPSQKSNGVFGVKLGTVAKREQGNVPRIVKKCLSEIERRGMYEVGIYRVSGVASGIQLLKASFDANRKDIDHILKEADINSVAGVLKLYFRELPEPLFTDKRYSDFVDAIILADPETKDKTICRLLADLPLANYHTFLHVRTHLIKVSSLESENKMSLHNLATVFGPTLLRPAESNNQNLDDVSILNNLRLGVHYQMGVLLFCLEMNDFPLHGAIKPTVNDMSPKSSSLMRVKSPLRTSTSVDSGDARIQHVPSQISMGSSSNRVNKPTKPITRFPTHGSNQPTPPKLAPRNQSYETVEGPAVDGKPFISSSIPITNSIRGTKPTPAPRRPSKHLPREKQYLM